LDLKIIGRKILTKAVRPFGLSVVPTKQLRGVSGFLQFFGMSVVWGRWNETEYISEGYMKSSAVYSIINRIAKTAAVAPFKVYRIKNKAKFKQYKAWTGANATKESLMKAMAIKALVYEEDTEHPLNKLLEKPNQWQGCAQFIINCVGYKLLTGNRFLYKTVLDIGPDAGNVYSLYNLPPHLMGVVPSGLNPFDVKEYQLQLGSVIVIPKDVVIHSAYWNPDINISGSHLK
jgi:phage portal protein BeeE